MFQKHANIYIDNMFWNVLKQSFKKLKKVEKLKNVFRKFQNILSQNNDLKKPLIKSNKATKTKFSPTTPINLS